MLSLHISHELFSKPILSKSKVMRPIWTQIKIQQELVAKLRPLFQWARTLNQCLYWFASSLHGKTDVKIWFAPLQILQKPGNPPRNSFIVFYYLFNNKTLFFTRTTISALLLLRTIVASPTNWFYSLFLESLFLLSWTLNHAAAMQVSLTSRNLIQQKLGLVENLVITDFSIY